ncbi:MAG: DUF1559 domain-containing protein [Planctomycetota bacterium]
MLEIRRNANRLGLTLVEILVSISVIGILLGLLLPAVHAARASARRVSCMNNAKQVALGLHNFEAAHARLPPGTELPPTDTLFRSWLSHTLPFIEQDAIYKNQLAAYEATANPFNVVEHEHLATRIPAFMCLEDGRISDVTIAAESGYIVGLSSYQGNLGTDYESRDGVLFGNSLVRFRDVSDGLSNTYVFGERPPSKGFDYGWWYAGAGAGDGTLDHTLGALETANSRFASCGEEFRSFRAGRWDRECDALHFWSMHSGGGHFAFLDGRVEFLSYDSAHILLALATRSENDTFVARGR